MGIVVEGSEVLNEEECLTLMRGARIGRVAVCQDGIAAVLPVAYLLVGRDVFFFTGRGTKRDAALRHTSVTFEVDEFDLGTESGWSVMVVGRAVVASAAATARAEALGLYPWAAGQRHYLVRLRPNLMSGRRLLK
ncbi:MAG: pyridoxamine 5'-phosphate oxidase family protein [Actinomycetota bacterium]|nr:pyridoxamine 5'-phosphate oxidase family protein [Actinomycetota bacterium]